MTTATAPPTGRHLKRAPVIALAVASALLVASVLMALLGGFGPTPWRSTAALYGASSRVGTGSWGDGSGPRGDGSWGDGPGDMMGRRSTDRMMGGGYSGMMAGQVWLAGNGRQVSTIDAARARAAQAGASAGLHPGEVMRFTRNFYVELRDSTGASATEVLVDPASGAVRTEPGPAMMWNTGSRTGAITQDAITQDQARAAATTWLRTNRPGETVATIDAYPGYYTVDTQVNGAVAGMLSVNATTGAVWYHTWHGTFVAMEDG